AGWCVGRARGDGGVAAWGGAARGRRPRVQVLHEQRRPVQQAVPAGHAGPSRGRGVNDTIDLAILATGVHDGRRFTSADLDRIVENHAKLAHAVRPALAGVVVAGQADGHPALGWVEKLHRAGDRLVASLSGVPSRVRDILERRAFASVSVELFPQWQRTLSEANLKTGVVGPVLSG